MRAVDADAILYTHKLEQKAIGKDWSVDDLATVVMTAPTIDAIPVEWLREYDDAFDNVLPISSALRAWEEGRLNNG